MFWIANSRVMRATGHVFCGGAVGGGGGGGVGVGVTKSTPASSYKVINSVCFSPLRLLPGRTDTFLFSTTLISLWAAGTVDIRGGKWSAWPWRNGSLLGGSDWLPLGERSTWQYLLIHSTTIKLCVRACVAVIQENRSNKWSTEAKLGCLAHSVWVAFYFGWSGK